MINTAHPLAPHASFFLAVLRRARRAGRADTARHTARRRPRRRFPSSSFVVSIFVWVCSVRFRRSPDAASPRPVSSFDRCRHDSCGAERRAFVPIDSSDGTCRSAASKSADPDGTRHGPRDATEHKNRTAERRVRVGNDRAHTSRQPCANHDHASEAHAQEAGTAHPRPISACAACSPRPAHKQTSDSAFLYAADCIVGSSRDHARPHRARPTVCALRAYPASIPVQPLAWHLLSPMRTPRTPSLVDHTQPTHAHPAPLHDAPTEHARRRRRERCAVRRGGAQAAARPIGLGRQRRAVLSSEPVTT